MKCKVKVTFNSGRSEIVDEEYPDVTKMIHDMSLNTYYIHAGGLLNMMEVETIKPLGAQRRTD